MPSCASGEWGPAKAIRHFNIHPITHFQSIFETSELPITIKFQCPKLLKFHGKLNSNQYPSSSKSNNSGHVLDPYVKYEYDEINLIIIFHIQLPSEGQYGFDIYARDPDFQSEKRTMSHCCKYIINYSKTSINTTYNVHPTILSDCGVFEKSKNIIDRISSTTKIGANANLLAQFGMTPVSHPDPTINLHSTNTVELQFQIRKMVDFTFDLILYQNNGKSSTQRLNAADFVTIKPNGGFNVVFSLHLPQPGLYTFTIYASTTSGSTGNADLPPVFTYFIRFV